MSVPPTSPEPNPLAALRANNRERFCNSLCRLVDVGTNVAESLDPGPRDPILPPLRGTLEVAQGYHLVARAVRQAILLADKLTEPLPPDPPDPRTRTHREASQTPRPATASERAETLDVERPERPEALERLDPLPDRSVPDLILDIRRDLGRAALPFTGPQPRFTAPGLAAIARFAPADRDAPSRPAAFHQGKHDP